MIKLTSKGKLSVHVSESMQFALLSLIEAAVHRNLPVRNTMLDADTQCEKMRLSLITEIYVRHYTTLSLINRGGRMLLTLAQAIALWSYWLEYSDEFSNPEMGNLFMQLHQKLT